MIRSLIFCRLFPREAALLDAYAAERERVRRRNEPAAIHARIYEHCDEGMRRYLSGAGPDDGRKWLTDADKARLSGLQDNG